MKTEYTTNHRKSENKGGTHMTELKAAIIKRLLQLFEEDARNGEHFWTDLLLCFVSCGDGFISEITEVSGNREAMAAVVAKWLPTTERSNKPV